MGTNDKYSRIANGDFSWQDECYDKIRNKKNVILSSPTGSGKTKVFLKWAEEQSGRPIIITAPIKALSNQRYRELLDAGYTVGLETGDIKNVPDDCDFICCTQEIYTNKYADLEDVTLIMDEFHYIFENPSRARTYIDALNKSKAKNILLCSATLGNLSKLTEYVNKVSGRDFFDYENDERLTSLFFEGNIEQKNIQNSLVVTFSKNNVKAILYILSLLREKQDKEKIEEIEDLAQKDKIENQSIIDYAQIGLAGYYGALLPKEKLFIEKCFERGLIDTVVGTDALALGVNFPVQNVIFAQLAKYFTGPISKNLFDQLAGRAGRKGYFDEGYVYYCSDFARLCESFEYDTPYLFERLLEKTNEDVSITLTPNIKSILLEETTIGEEAEFISKFSTEEIDVDEEFKYISKIIDYIKNYAFEQEVRRIVHERFSSDYEDDYYDDDEYDDGYYDDSYYDSDYYDGEQAKYEIELLEKKEEFLQNIERVYFDEFSPEKNCAIFTEILCGIDPDEIMQRYALSGGFRDMLQFRKYVNSLPRKYRKGLTKISHIIREIDDTAIDGFRGSVSTDEISEQLEQEGRLEGRKVRNILKEQEQIKKMSERAEVLDEQLRIAEQYGLEDY